MARRNPRDSQTTYLIGVLAGSALAALVVVYAFQSPHNQTQALEQAEVEVAARATTPNTSPAESAPAMKTPAAPPPLARASGESAGPSGLSAECLSLRDGLAGLKLDDWRHGSLDLRAAPPVTPCRSASKPLTAAELLYAARCAPVLEGRFLDERNLEDHQILAACANAARELKAWLGYLATTGKSLADITDPSLLVDRLLVAAGGVAGAPHTASRGPLKLDPASLSEISDTSLRLLQIADTQQDKNLASRYYLISQSQSLGLRPGQVFQISGRTLANTSAAAASASGASASDPDQTSRAIDDIRNQVETYNPDFFNRSRRHAR